VPDPLDPPDPPERPKVKRENGSAWPAWLIAYAATLFVLRDVILTLFK
jgi:hypothetical protein